MSWSKVKMGFVFLLLFVAIAVPVNFGLQLDDTEQKIAIRNTLVGLASGGMTAWMARNSKSVLVIFLLGLVAHIVCSLCVVAIFLTGDVGFAIYYAMFEIVFWVPIFIYFFVIASAAFSTFFGEKT